MNKLLLLVLVASFACGAVGLLDFTYKGCKISRLPSLNEFGHRKSSQLRIGIETKADYDNFQKFNAAKTTVRIGAPTINSRRITADIIINTSMDKVWSILTDYNNLATHVPNLVQSYRVSVPGETAKIRLFQEGAQRIIGFDFRASLMMDMSEQPFQEYDGIPMKQRKLSFKLVESKMFQTFDGSWTVDLHSKQREYDTKMQKQIDKYKTKLTYEVLVRPKGPVPVIAASRRTFRLISGRSSWLLSDCLTQTGNPRGRPRWFDRFLCRQPTRRACEPIGRPMKR